MPSTNELRVLFLIAMDRKTQNKITALFSRFAYNQLNSSFVYSIPRTQAEVHDALQKQWDIIFIENSSFSKFSQLAIKLVRVPGHNVTDLIILNTRLYQKRLHSLLAKNFRNIFLVDQQLYDFIEVYLEEYQM